MSIFLFLKNNTTCLERYITSKTIKIFGSPGTGKTETLLKILEEKIAEGFEPKRIGFFSFTRRAIK